ncbi:MAG: hypothetical protein LW832_00350, partial [Parachlamydia sp.]|nr:hypothetical protein [Parachlamydia sp.]
MHSIGNHLADCHMTPPPQLFSSESLIFLFFNLVSLGLYGTAQMNCQQISAKKLDIQNKNFENKVAGLLTEIGEIEQEIHQASKRAAVGEAVDYSRLEGRVLQIPTQYADMMTESDQPFVSFSFVNTISNLFSNIMTLGLYALYHTRSLQSDLYFDTSKQYRDKTIGKKQADHVAKRLAAKIEKIKDAEKMRQENEELINGPLGREYSNLNELRNERKHLLREAALLKNEKPRWEAARRKLEISLERLREEKASSEQLVQELEEQYQALLARYPNHLNIDVNELRKIARKRDKKDIKLNQLIEEQANLENQIVGSNQNLDPQKRDLLRLGPVPAKYEKTADDQEIKGVYGIEPGETDEALLTDYAKRYNGRQTALKIIQTAVDYSIQELLRLSEQDSPKIHFNKSYFIFDEKYKKHKYAIYSLAALDFIMNGKLFKKGNDFQLKLNADGVCMGSSRPHVVQTNRIDPM